MSTRHFFPCFVFAVILFALQSMFSQTADSIVVQLDSVTTSATRFPEKLHNQSRSLSIADQTVLQYAQQQLSLQEPLANIPGVFILNPDNFAQDLRIAIRGFGARSSFGIRGIKILVDGIPESTPDGQAQVDNLSAGVIREAEILRGPASAFWGNAAGGIILLQTEEAPGHPFLQARLSNGAYGFQQLQFKSGQQYGNTNYLFHFVYNGTDGYRPHSKMQNYLGNAAIRWRPDPASALNIFINAAHSPIAQDPGAIDSSAVANNRRQARERNITFDSGESVTQEKLAVTYQREKNNHRYFLRTFFRHRDFANRLPFESGGIVNLNRFHAGGGIQIDAQTKLFERPLHFSIGYDIEKQWDERSRFDNLEGRKGNKALDQTETFLSNGFYLQQNLRLSPRWKFNTALRYDAIQLAVIDNFLTDGENSGKRNLYDFSPSVGALFKITEQVNLYGNMSSSFETPALVELSNNPSGEGGFNPTLLPQKAANYEIGFKGLWPKQFRFALALFHINLSDELTPYELAEFPGRVFYRNAGKSQRRGLEASLSANIRPGLNLNASYSYARFKYRRFTIDEASLAGNRLPGIPAHLANLGLFYATASGFSARTTLSYTGNFFADNSNNIQVDNYIVGNLRVAYQFTRDKWELNPFIGLNNFLNKKYFSNIRLNAFGGRYFEAAPGFHIFGGIQINIGG